MVVEWWSNGGRMMRYTQSKRWSSLVRDTHLEASRDLIGSLAGKRVHGLLDMAVRVAVRISTFLRGVGGGLERVGRWEG
jgi:hypothetical protein